MAVAPAWDELQWRRAPAVAAIHGISPWLSGRLRWAGPSQWQQFLAQQWQHTNQRFQGIESLRRRIDHEARRRRLGLVALKGIALHDLALYRPGERPMADIDLLIRERDLSAASELLATLGYVEVTCNRRERVFAPLNAAEPTGFGEHARNPIKIDLHTHVAEQLPVQSVDITELLLPDPGVAGLQGYATRATLMTHLLLHAAGNMRARSLRMIQLNDIAALAGRLESPDWEQVLAHERRFGCRWTYPPLALTSRYFRGVIPADVLTEAAGNCPPGLRRASGRQRLSDVSLSNSWIEFCPGIEWCGSLAEKLRFARGRAFPAAEVRAEMRTCESTETWARASPWFALSRAQRVIRWIFSRPQRVATMWSIRTALQESPP